MARGRVLFLSGSVIGTASIVPYKHFSRLRHDRMILPCSFSRLFRHGSIQHSRYPLRQLFGGLGCCQLSVAAGSQYGGVQAVRHSGQSRAFKCGVKWEIHKSHHAVVGFHHQRVHQACRCDSRTASDGIRQTAGSAHDGSTHILVQQKVDQNRRFFRVLAAAVDGKGQIYFRKSAVGLPSKGDLIPYQKAAGIF